MRFVQVSDVHLGAPLTATALQLPPEKREQRRRELAAALRAACDLAGDEGAEVILLPGDLFDHEGVSRDTLAETVETLGACGLPIVLAPGNHDFLSPASYCSPAFLLARHNLAWPDNVHLFAGSDWTRLRLPALAGVAFTGIAFTSHDGPDGRPLASLPPPEHGVRNVLVFHGSRSGHAPQGKCAVLPFRDEELAAAGYDYAALGHYHNAATVLDAAGRVLGAYAGCPAGRGLDECGPRGVLLGELTADGVQVASVRVDGRVIHDLRVDCTGIGYDAALLQRIEDAVRAAGVRPPDIVHVQLAGHAGRTLEISIPPGFLLADGRCYHLQVDASALAPDYDLDAYRDGAAHTVEGRFVHEIERRLAAAQTADERALLQRTLYYGLDALVSRTVTPRYERGE